MCMVLCIMTEHMTGSRRSRNTRGLREQTQESEVLSWSIYLPVLQPLMSLFPHLELGNRKRKLQDQFAGL